jgi:hypothetical protein
MGAWWMKDQKLPVISAGLRLRRVESSHFREWLLQANEIEGWLPRDVHVP